MSIQEKIDNAKPTTWLTDGIPKWKVKLIIWWAKMRARIHLGRQKKIKPLTDKHKIKMLGYRSNFIVIDEFVTADRKKEEPNANKLS